MPRQRVADSVRAALVPPSLSERKSAEMSSRDVSTASVHCCDEEGREEDGCDDRHRACSYCAGATVTERGGAVKG